jgi:hypothetical protein
MPRCSHGEYNNRQGNLTGSMQKAADKHKQRCRKPGEVFGHPGPWLGIFPCVCCSGCKKSVA